MTHIRLDYWIPTLRQLTKKIINKCNRCKRFHTKPYPSPIQGQLPKDRTEQNLPFKVIGVDYAGPIYCKTKSKKETKVYILLFTCSISRAVHLEVLPNQTAAEFIKAFKRLIARRGRVQVIYSDNAKTFVSASKWVQKINKDVEFRDFLASEKIRWKFNLSRAPWWGGQFERMIGLMKQMLYKAVGNAHLTMEEMQEVMLDIEINMNNRPLTYIDDDIEQPILTPNALLHGQIIYVPDIELDEGNPDIRKRQRYINRCKKAAWRRWNNDYLKALRERHNMKCKTSSMQIKEGDVMLIKSSEKNRGRWKIGIVNDLYYGKDKVVRAARLRAGKSYLERPIQHLYPLELTCDITPTSKSNDKKSSDSELNANASEFKPKRNAAAIARLKMQDDFENEERHDQN